jgi:hypothetical protein
MSGKEGCPNCESLKQQRDWLARNKVMMQGYLDGANRATFALAKDVSEYAKKLTEAQAEVKRLTEVNKYITKYPASAPKV